jgi:phosphoglycolate phosphatase-like HAD superfamily hydrolase
MMDRGLKFIGADDYIEVAIGYDSVHIHKPGPYPVRAALEKLGKHKTGVGCLYINKLDDIDLKILKGMIETSLKRK